MNSSSQTPEAAPNEEPSFSSVRSRYPSFLSSKFDLLQILKDSGQLIYEGWRDLLFIFVALQVPLIIVSQLLLPSEPEAVAGAEAASRFFPIIVFFAFVGMFVTVNVLTASRYIVFGAPKPLHEIFTHSIVKFPIVVIAAIGAWGIVMLSFFPALAAIANLGISAPGLLLFFVLLTPVVIVAVYASLFMHSIVLGDRGVLGGLIHGFSLVKGNWWRVFSLYLVIVAASLLIALPISFFDFLFEPGIMLRFVIKFVIGILGLLLTIPTINLYYNLLGVNHERIGANHIQSHSQHL